MIRFRMGEGLVKLADRVAAPQNISGAGILIQKLYVPGYSGGG
jgi:hypothetical protein